MLKSGPSSRSRSLSPQESQSELGPLGGGISSTQVRHLEHVRLVCGSPTKTSLRSIDYNYPGLVTMESQIDRKAKHRSIQWFKIDTIGTFSVSLKKIEDIHYSGTFRWDENSGCIFCLQSFKLYDP